MKKWIQTLLIGVMLTASAPLFADDTTTPATAAAAPAAASAPAPTLNAGDTAWMLTSTLLVIMMSIPGLALYYGGLTRSKNVLSVLAQVLAVFSLVEVLWALYGYSYAFVGGGNYFGSAAEALMKGITPDTLSGTIPEYVFAAFQSAFAAITLCLIVGSFAERIKFKAVLIFTAIWFTFAYVPVAHIMWASTGWLFNAGILDFAGGTVIHINSGVAGLVGAYFVGKRTGYGTLPFKPHNLVFTYTGACLLWVGWFGFNAGSALTAGGSAALAFINTVYATAIAVLTWLALEAVFRGKASLLGGATGAVAGLVVITPACGFVGPMGSLALGVLGSAAAFWGVNGLKRILNVDDSFDAFGVHAVAGIVGAILTGVFAAGALGGIKGSDYSIASQLVIQVKGVVVTILISAVVAAIAYYIAGLLSGGLRVTKEEEEQGLDVSSHGENAYE